ncbi:Orange carotenoid protein [Oxynema sp. CENA135]|jgi:hypothetical protein|uniref:Orange carotenoid protein n=1 Tax=Oxynema aestuarii AP17 TaxID=2064643 RepID=A0A6H1U2B4_9CYAN|nr:MULTISPECIES: orange carotenoid protein N-terminal domain-containing protein [Oxynema]MBK4731470.1 Orange carotenoid protein [Oxynema sp. CENA135]QIZ72795.1 Orange carotenoid protein [Oxynema aestuarii AP17]RMH77640.1 MAG: Orange carotenoid protein [Cyanobacteria bacterium J007]
MAVTTEFNTAIFNPQLEAVPATLAEYERLSTDDKLGLLWVIYENLGGAITPAAPGAARMQFAEGLLNQIREMPFEAQLQAMRDLVEKVNNPISRAYGVLSNNNKLAFWFQLAEWMKSGEVIPVPANYSLSPRASAVFNRITLLDFNQQITVLRKAATDMGIDPFA